MFSGISPLLLVGLSLLPGGGEKEKRFVPFGSFFMKGKILEVFDDGRVLIPIGTNQGARKGMTMAVYRLEPGPLNIGRIELVEVGAKYSIGRFLENEGRPGLVRENDLVSLFSPIVPRLGEIPRFPVWQQPGGAIVDPEGLLKRK